MIFFICNCVEGMGYWIVYVDVSISDVDKVVNLKWVFNERFWKEW